MIRILLCDDHAIVREGVRMLLGEQPGYQIVGEASDGHEAIKAVEALEPDIVLMDIAMPGLGGVSATEQIKKLRPRTRVLVLSMVSDAPVVRAALKAGADGYVVKGAGVARLLEALETARRGKLFLSPEIESAVAEGINRKTTVAEEAEPLSDREREIVTLVAQGLTNAEIGARLFISPKTVANHRNNIMRKLDLHDTAAITRYAIRQGLCVP